MSLTGQYFGLCIKFYYPETFTSYREHNFPTIGLTTISNNQIS